MTRKNNHYNYKWQVDMCLMLLRAALTGVAPSEEVFANLTDEQWKSIYLTSMAHGVQTLVRDGWVLLDESCYPPSQVRVTWAFEASKTEKRYAEKFKAFASLNDFLANAGIDYVLLKGFTTASLYPVPLHRDCCDIDIFSFEHDDIDKLVEQQGITVDSSPCSEKHSLFCWQHTPVENHIEISYEERLKSHEVVSKCFMDAMASEHRKQSVVGPRGETIDVEAVPSSILFAYNAYHILGHYVWKNITMRHLADWYVLRKGIKEPDGSCGKAYPQLLALYIGVLDEITQYCFGTFSTSEIADANASTDANAVNNANASNTSLINLSVLAQKYMQSVYDVQNIPEEQNLMYNLSLGKRLQHLKERYTKYSSLAPEDRLSVLEVWREVYKRYVLNIRE